MRELWDPERMTSYVRGYHPAHMAAAVTFLALLVSALLRAAPGVMMVPLKSHFGWNRATLSFSAALGLLLYGLVGSFAAALMSAPCLPSRGVLSSIGMEAVASLFGAAVGNRWLVLLQGPVTGLLSACIATRALVSLPFFVWLLEGNPWKPVALAVSLGCAALIPVVALLAPERPEARERRRFGESDAAAAPMRKAASPWLAIGALRRAAWMAILWLLAGTLLVCGPITNGLVGPHMIALCGGSSIAAVATVVFGWVSVAHRMGVAVAAYGAGAVPPAVGLYTPAFVLAGAFAVPASLVFVTAFRRPEPIGRTRAA